MVSASCLSSISGAVPLTLATRHHSAVSLQPIINSRLSEKKSRIINLSMFVKYAGKYISESRREFSRLTCAELFSFSSFVDKHVSSYR